MTFPRHVGVLTRELVSYHEAGHIATAVMVGASVKSVELFRGPPPYAKTSIDRTDPQAIFIACGGFAAEYHLFDRKRLVDTGGQTVDATLFLNEAQKNASEDVRNFDKALTRLGHRPVVPMDEFMGVAGKVRKRLDFNRIEKIAEALLEHGSLNSEQIAHYAGPLPARWRANYSLARVNGQGWFRSFMSAFR